MLSLQRFRASFRCLPSCRYTFSARHFHSSYSAFNSQIQNIENEDLVDHLVEPIHPALLTRAKALSKEFFELQEIINTSLKIDSNHSRKYNKLNNFYQIYNEFQNLNSEYEELNSIINNPQEDELLIEEAKVELNELVPNLNKSIISFKNELLPKHPFHDKATLIELRTGVGGTESNIFTEDLLNMYTRYCEFHNWKYEVVNKTDHQSGNGIIEASIIVNHLGSYNRLRFEAGVHRVQRVPLTETKNRVHTSTAAVIILPKFDENNTTGDPDMIQFKPGELRIDVMRASGSGGQHVNTTESAVRITHLPTGIAVINQDGRSQPKNKEKAMTILRSRLAERELKIKQEQDKKDRTDQVNTTDRSDKIRTYNFPQNRISDHRCNFTLFDLEGCMNGSKLDEIIDNLEKWDLQVKSELLIKDMS